MKSWRPAWTLAAAVGLVSLSGANCPQHLVHKPVLGPSATLEEVIQAVNGNNAQIESFSTPQAEITADGMPAALKGPLAFQRPKRFRFHGGTLLTGPEVDLGSNDDLFWIWARRSPQPAVFYCRHELFGQSPIRQMLPVDPDWLVEALGVGRFDPGFPHQGPYPMKNGGLEVRTIRETDAGPITKITVVDPNRGAIAGQYLYDPQGRMMASAVAPEHRVDPLTGLVIARKIELRVPAAQFAMKMDLGNVQVNRLAGNPQELWAMPRYEGYPLVDLSDPSFRIEPASQGPQAPPVSQRRPEPQRGWQRR